MKSSKSRPLFSRASLMVAAALLAVAAPRPAKAANLTWNQVGGGIDYSWINTANWTGGTGIPDGIGDVAQLGVNLSGDQTLNLDANITLSTLNIGDTVGASTFTINTGINRLPGILALAQPAGFQGVGSIVLDAPGIASAVAINKSGAGNDTINTLIYFNDPLTVTANGAGTITFSAGMRSGQSDVIYTGASGSRINLTGGAVITGGDFIKEGAGTLNLATVSTYSGATIVRDGVLIAGSNAFPARSPLTLLAPATLNLNGQTGVTFGSITGAGLITNLNAATTVAVLTFGRDESSTLFTGQIQPRIAGESGRVSITKLGAGTFTFAPSVASTYTGATNIQGGKFVLDFANSGALTSLMAATPLTFSAGSIFELKGRAALGVAQTVGAVTVNQGGAKIAVVPGDATAVTRLTLAGLAFGTGTNAGTLLVTAPAATQVSVWSRAIAERVREVSAQTTSVP
jgi:fibronectin-binding autotransporter adhesin